MQATITQVLKAPGHLGTGLTKHTPLCGQENRFHSQDHPVPRTESAFNEKEECLCENTKTRGAKDRI